MGPCYDSATIGNRDFISVNKYSISANASLIKAIGILTLLDVDQDNDYCILLIVHNIRPFLQTNPLSMIRKTSTHAQ